jgi:hypothetical protein
LNVKSKLLASALGMALLGASALALADNGRGHDRDSGPSYHGRHDAGGHGHGGPHRDNRRHAYGPAHGHWHAPAWGRPGWRAPYYQRHHYGYAPRHYGRYDDGVTIIFKGRID